MYKTAVALASKRLRETTNLHAHFAALQLNCFNRVDERQSDITLRENITEINIYFHVDIKKKVLKVGKKKSQQTNKKKKTRCLLEP